MLKAIRPLDVSSSKLRRDNRRTSSAARRISGPRGSRAYDEWVANNALRPQRNARCNWAIDLQVLPPTEMRKLDLVSHATIELEPARLQSQLPTAARKSLHPLLLPQPKLAMRGVGSRK